MILNRQRRVAISLRSLERFWERVCLILHLPQDAVTICLVSEAAIAGWNRTYRGKEGPTDVLSFPCEQIPAGRPQSGTNGHRVLPPSRARRRAAARAPVGPGHYLGDIAIAPAVARDNARRFGRTFEQELRILILHGVLHLLGYDHETDQGEMGRLERRLRRRLGLGGK